MIRVLLKTFRRHQFAEPAQLQSLLRNALRVIAHALEFEVDLDRRRGKPQVHPHGLLAHDKFQAQPVDLAIQRVDERVAQNDRVGELPVAGHERHDAVAQALFGVPGHLGDFCTQTVEVTLE